jgi:hypothetical protein
LGEVHIMAGAAKVVGSLVLVLLGSLMAPSTAPAQTAASPTFSKDVLPILQRSCQKCHRPGTAAPMSLLTYQDVRPWVRSHGWTDIAFLTAEQYQEELAKRAVHKKATSTGNNQQQN